MFAFVSAFPKCLHCTDEAQHAETVLSAVLSIYIYMKRLMVGGRQINTRRTAANVRAATEKKQVRDLSLHSSSGRYMEFQNQTN